MIVQSVSSSPSFKSNIKNLDMAENLQQVARNADKTNKKKTTIIGGLAALAIVGTIATVAIIKHKNMPCDVKKALNNFKTTNSNAESAQKQINGITENCKKIYNEVTELYKYFQYLTKKHPTPFEKIGYYCSIEFYKGLFKKYKNEE